jgi:general secretion pathway protein C
LFRDYLYKILADKWMRNMATLAVLALLAFQLSITFWQFFPAPDIGDNNLRSQIERGGNLITPRQSYIEKAQLIGRGYLFGKQQVEKSAIVETDVAPETKLNYKLRGIYYSELDRLSSVIVETKINDSKYYRLDDELADNITLAAIERDHILINRYGKIERLNLEKSVVGTRAGGINTRSNNPNSLASTALLRSYKKRYVSNPMALAKRFQAIPVTENGRNIGFRLKALRGESLLKKLNFQDGDVFTKVNGIGLDKPFQALDALKSLTTASSVSVTVRRNGNEETINFSM